MTDNNGSQDGVLPAQTAVGQEEAMVPFDIPMLDISKEVERHVIVAQGTAESYKGHPTTLLMPDGSTMFCVYPLGHGGPSVLLQRSDDGGLSWTDPLPVPENWKTASNCPAIHRFVGPDSVERLFVFEGEGKMRQAMSLDRGETWTPFEENGLRTTMPFTSIVEIAQNRLLGVWSGEGVSFSSVSEDGGLTWGPERILLTSGGSFPDSKPCEPALIRSPDGKELACVFRVIRLWRDRHCWSQWRSLVTFSSNEGESWTNPVELDRTMTGDRHQPCYAADGRLVIAFRDRTAKSPTWGHFVAWVGSYEDLRKCRAGEYRIKLLHSYDEEKPHDCGYPGLELLPDDTMVATTYVKYRPGPEKQSVVSVRFKLDQFNQLIQ